MTDPANLGEVSAPSEPETGGNRRDTVVLSDIPDVAGFAPPPPRNFSSDPNLSSGALTALARRYDVLAEAGHGNMGNVYKARDRETGETVALKLIKPEFASEPGMIERFKNELLFARKITHKNVCRVYDFHRVGGVAYTSMEFVEGESLRSVLNRFGSLPLRKGIDLTFQICSGLKEAHAQGIVHRDLKPENVMVDSQGNVKIMDFGIARSMEAVTRLTGAMVGTPAYMAPEQAEGKPVDCRTDIYSLGLILYEIFTGKQAFSGDNPVTVALKQMRESPVSPHEIEPAIPVSIERATLRCLEKDPAKRYQSVSELENDLISSGTRAILATGPGVRTTLSNREAIATSADAAASARSRTPSNESKRTSAILWALLGIFIALPALSALHWMRVSQSAKKLPPPSELPAPTPPAFALDKSLATARSVKSVEPRPPAQTPTATRAISPDTEPSLTQAPSANAIAEPAKATAAPTSLPPSAPGMQQRAARAFAQDRALGNETGATYLWMGRFQREDRAQETAKKIESLGLPAVIVPRHNPTGDFFVLLSGPFAPQAVSAAMDQLQGQGFANIHVIRNLRLNQ
jgi:serine/threonine protein kinase